MKNVHILSALIALSCVPGMFSTESNADKTTFLSHIRKAFQPSPKPVVDIKDDSGTLLYSGYHVQESRDRACTVRNLFIAHGSVGLVGTIALEKMGPPHRGTKPFAAAIGALDLFGIVGTSYQIHKADTFLAKIPNERHPSTVQQDFEMLSEKLKAMKQTDLTVDTEPGSYHWTTGAVIRERHRKAFNVGCVAVFAGLSAFFSGRS